MNTIRHWMTLTSLTLLTVTLTADAWAASDAKKVEHAVSGAVHRVGEGYHKQVKDYHLRQARHQARKGHLHRALRHVDKAEKHDVAEKTQHHKARVKEKALRHD